MKDDLDEQADEGLVLLSTVSRSKPLHEHGNEHALDNESRHRFDECHGSSRIEDVAEVANMEGL